MPIPGEEKHEANAVSAKVSLADCASIAALIGSAFLASGLWYWLAYPPVQHYYLGAYFEGAFVDDHSTVAVPVQWTPLANSLLHSHNAAMITLPKMMTRLKIPRNPLT